MFEHLERQFDRQATCERRKAAHNRASRRAHRRANANLKGH